MYLKEGNYIKQLPTCDAKLKYSVVLFLGWHKIPWPLKLQRTITSQRGLCLSPDAPPEHMHVESAAKKGNKFLQSHGY